MEKNKLQDLKARTRGFALQIIRLYSALPKTTVAQVVGKQFLRSGTAVGAAYHEAQRAKSNADFIHKLEGALQELEETSYWLALLNDAALIPFARIQPVANEATELNAIFTSMVRNVKDKGGK